jgi:hypothetical protein
MELVMYILAPEPCLSGVLDKSLYSVCVRMCNPPSLLGNGSAKRYCGNEYTRKRTVGDVIFFAVGAV